MDANGDEGLPQQGLDIRSTSECRVVSLQSRKSFLVMGTTKAPTFKPNNRAPVDLVCVIDVSGSMAGDRISLVKKTLQFMVKHLQDDDRLCLVTYSTNSKTALQFVQMNQSGKNSATATVDSISTGGSTNLCGGLVLGVKNMRARKASKKNPVGSVLLFTDGHANEGHIAARDIIRSVDDPNFAAASAGPSLRRRRRVQRAPVQPRGFRQKITAKWDRAGKVARCSSVAIPIGLIALLSYVLGLGNTMAAGSIVATVMLFAAMRMFMYQKVPQQPAPPPDDEEEKADVTMGGPLPCSINTFGFGAGHNSQTLEEIAKYGKGSYFFVEGVDNIGEAFADCLGGLLSTVGEKLKLRIEIPHDAEGQRPQTTINKILNKSYKSQALVDGLSYEVDLQDIQSEESRDILCEISLPESKADEINVPVLKFTLDYFNVITKTDSSCSCMCFIDRKGGAPIQDRDVKLDKQFNRLACVEAMDKANNLADRNKLGDAREVLTEAQSAIERSASSSDEFCVNLVGDLKRLADTLRSKESYQSAGRHSAYNQISSHSYQRSTNRAWSSQAAYSTSNRMSKWDSL